MASFQFQSCLCGHVETYEALLLQLLARLNNPKPTPTRYTNKQALLLCYYVRYVEKRTLTDRQTDRQKHDRILEKKYIKHEPGASFPTLPPELQLMVLPHLDLPGLLSLRWTCRLVRHFITREVIASTLFSKSTPTPTP